MICAPGTHEPHDRVIWYAMPHQPGLRLTGLTTMSVALIWLNTIDPALTREWRLP